MTQPSLMIPSDSDAPLCGQTSVIACGSPSSFVSRIGLAGQHDPVRSRLLEVVEVQDPMDLHAQPLGRRTDTGTPPIAHSSALTS